MTNPVFHCPTASVDRPDSDPEAVPTLLHEFFEQAAHIWPERVAIDVPPSLTRARRTIRYDELLLRVNALSNRLREFVTGECVVAILLERNSELIYLAQFAVLKAGAAYTCLDPSFPDAQLTTILDDSRPVLVLADLAGSKRLRRSRPDLTCLDIARVDSLAHPVEPLAPPAWLTPRSLAYVIYTSGTTGRPKGVMVEHAGVVNLVRGDRLTFPVAPEDRVAQNSSCAYDSSIEETWMALSNGATLVVMDDEANRLGPDLVEWLHRERITIFCPPPTLLRSTGCDDPHEHLPGLRRIHVGGEALPDDLARRWAVGRCLVNDYGPTESTIVCLRTVLDQHDPVAIGKPVPGMRAWVLNEQLDEVALGERGELCVGGVGLARGYMNDPDLTARKFPLHPRLGRIYRTGDLAHCDQSGTFFCHGRIDTQVKIRGYRIELEAIESRLADCPGVRAAACRVQGDGPQQQIVAFIVPESELAPPSFDELRLLLGRSLPSYMIPSHFGFLSSLPTSVSGKLDRRALPILDTHHPESTGHVAPRDRMEEAIGEAVGSILGLTGVSVDQDFFTELGGDSLRAAGLISRLREDAKTARLTVRDLYEARTVAGLAARARASCERQSPREPLAERPVGRPLLATLAQTVWLSVGLILGGAATYLFAFEAVPHLAHEFGLVPFLLVSPLLAALSLSAYTVVALALAVVAKRVLIGKYRPRREPVWGWFFVRNWMVQRIVHLIPWSLLEGTVFRNVALRALGARIGQRVHIHRGVDLTQGGWDLLDIGDDASIGQDVSLRLIDLEAGQIVVAPVCLGAGSTLAVRSGVGGGAALEADAYLTPLSFLANGTTIPRGERWDGIPAVPLDDAPERPPIADSSLPLSEWAYSLVLLLARFLLALFVALPVELAALAFALLSTGDVEEIGHWLRSPSASAGELLLGLAGLCLAVPLTLVLQGVAMRLLGRVSEGTVSRWSLAYVRIWLKTGLVDSANGWLSGTLLWRVWLRGAGMKIGRNSEVGTILDTVPELVEIGSGTFFADGVYLAGAHVHRGSVALARTRLGDGVFLGNHAVVLAGQTLPDGVLLGVCTVADETLLRPGSSWFGHPPFELPNREVVEFDRSQTHEPSWMRYLNRVFWELLRFALPIAPVILALLWTVLVLQAESRYSSSLLLLAIVPALEFAYLAALCLLVLGLKWLLLGRVAPGMHPLWSCWCSRWDFHYLVWERYARGALSALEGTLWLNWYLRAMGVRIGRGVVLGSGYAHVVDPDMLSFADGATSSALFQAHTFEDRVLKIDRVHIDAGASLGYAAVLLYGAEIGERTHVLPHSVVMKRERLLAEHAYAGCPTHLVE